MVEVNNSNKLLEKIMSLASDGFEIRFTPEYYSDDCIELRLSKDYHRVARIISMTDIHQCCAWKSDEDAFLYYLDCLVDEYKRYVEKYIKGE